MVTNDYYKESLTADVLSLGQALSLDGIEDYVDVPIESLLPTLTDSTYAIWVNISSDSDGNWMRAFDFGVDTSAYMFLTPRSGTSGSPEFGILSPNSDSAVEQDVASDQTLTDDWHHLAVVIEGDTLMLYVDGVLKDTDSTDTLPCDLGETENNWLGQSQWEDDDFYDGLLDEFVIYSRALCAGEIRYLAGDR